MEGQINFNNDTNIIDLTDKTANIKLKDKPKSEETLTSMIEEILKNSNLKEHIHLKADEIVSSSTCIKQLFIEGRVGKESEMDVNGLQIKICEKVATRLGNSLNMKEFWKVEIGLKEGDKFSEIEALDLNGEKVKVVHEPGTVLILNFWSIWSDLETYLNFKVELMKKIKDGKVEGVTSENIRCFSICGEENFSNWKALASDEELNSLIPQYNNKNAYDIIGIKQVPFLILVDKEGIIKYLGIFKNVNLEETIKGLVNNIVLDKIEEKSEEKIEEKPEEEKNLNEWWLDFDAESKVDVVRNINLSMREMGSYSSQFVVITKYTHLPTGVKSNTVPVFLGTMFETEYEIIQNYAIELQSSMNFNNFVFNCKVIAHSNDY